MAKVSREKVFEVIKSERDYQEKKVIPDNRYKREASLGELICLIGRYADKARDQWTAFSDELPNPPCLEVVREVAALAVRCMELHGAPERKIKESQF